MSKKVEMEVAGKKVMISNLDKVLYPAAGFTKRQVIDYYVRIAPVLLPHLKNRPITLKRYPDGVDGFFFYEKQCPSHRPDWMKTTEVPSQREEGKIDYCLMNDLPALVWAANLADLELHTFLHRAPAITRPTSLAFDLDPGAPADMVLCCQVALWLRGVFDKTGSAILRQNLWLERSANLRSAQHRHDLRADEVVRPLASGENGARASRACGLPHAEGAS